MNITVEPTPEVFHAVINGVEIPLRIWKGKTDGGIAIEAYVLSITPNNSADHEALGEALPFKRKSRDVFHIDLSKGHSTFD